MTTFQEIIHDLLEYWMDYGCIIQQPYDVEVGAGTMHPETFFRVLGSQPYKVAYVQPFSPAHRWPLRRESQSCLSALSAPGDFEALSGGRPRRFTWRA